MKNYLKLFSFRSVNKIIDSLPLYSLSKLWNSLKYTELLKDTKAFCNQVKKDFINSYSIDCNHGAFLCTREVTKKCPYTCHTPLESYDSQLSEYVWLDIKTSSGFCRVAILVLNYKAKLLIF